MLSVQKSTDTDLNHPSYFPKMKGILTVIRIGTGAQQIWGMVEEANKVINMTPPLAVYGNEDAGEFNNFCCGWTPFSVQLPGTLVASSKLAWHKINGKGRRRPHPDKV